MSTPSESSRTAAQARDKLGGGGQSPGWRLGEGPLEIGGQRGAWWEDVVKVGKQSPCP